MQAQASTSGGFARAGFWIHRHHRWVIAFWAAVVLACLPFAPQAVRRLQPGGFSSPHHEAQRAADLLQEAFQSSPATLVAVYTSTEWTADDPRFLQAIDTSLARVRPLAGVAAITTQRENALQASPDGHTAYA